MPLKNKSTYAILGILSLSPSTGYEIKRYSDQVLSGFWNENFGHIYPTLKSMLAEGTIEVVKEKPESKRICYAITEKGRRELDTWLLAETTPQPVRSEFLLKLLFSSSQPATRVTEMLVCYRAQHEVNRERYLDMQRALNDGITGISDIRARYLGVVLNNGIAVSESVIRWCNETIETLQREA